MPLLLSLAFFCHLAVCGRAMFRLLGLRLGHERTWLLAPALGLATLGLMVMVLNQAGLPIATFARPLMLVTLLGAVLVLIRGRVLVPRALLPFAGIALGALILGGWPALVYGFDWVSYGNDDMTNYCLGAHRFLTHGFYAVPTPQDLDGGDYSQFYWLMHVAAQIRFGSEQTIACLAGACGLPTIRVFMPVILAFALTQLWAIIGLAYSCPRRRKLALTAGTILAISPMWHYGTTYQLIAQVGGLALLAAILAITARTRFPRIRAGQLRLAVASAILIGALGIFYSELFPFLVGGWGIYVVLQVFSRRRWIPGLLPTVGLMLMAVLVLLRHNVVSTSLSLLGQVHEGMNAAQATRVSLFPYFLMPSGPAFFFGFNVIVWRYPDAVSSLALVGGFAAVAIALGLWLRGLRERTVSASVLAGMLPLGALLFRAGNGFGLFKLVMFALPFVAIELARLGDIRRFRRLAGTAFLVLFAVWMVGAIRYTHASLTTTLNPVNELFTASASRGNLPTGAAPVWADISSSPVAKLFMLEEPGARPAFLSQIYNARLFGIAARPLPDWTYRVMPGHLRASTAAGLVDHIQNHVYHLEKLPGLSFWSCAAAEQSPPGSAAVLVTSIAEQHSFNKLRPSAFPATDGIFNQTELSRLENHLAFIQTTLGQHYYLGDDEHISVYKPERDLYAPNDHFFAIGRHLLFRVINPTGVARLRFSVTASLLGDGRTELPAQATVQDGTPERVPLGLVGAGSANVFSAPLQPLLIGGVSYLALDLGRPALPIGRPASGLQGLYNRNLSLDTRFGLGYCRDISLLSEQSYLALPRRREVRRFPADLAGQDAVEYSGLYEDGWVSGRAFVVLGPVVAGDKIIVTGMRPQIPGVKASKQQVELRVGGVGVLAQDIPPGRFTLEAPLNQAAPQVRIELHFDHDEALPAPDHRPVTVLLESIKITSSL